MDVQYDDNFLRRKWKVKDDVVISGLSGRFPKSESVQQFTDNLFNSVEMLTAGNDRFPSGYNNFPLKSGKVENLHKFDAKFFNYDDYQANHLDPYIRKLLEVTYEAIVDAGLDVDSLRGSNTGFYYGESFKETEKAWGERQFEIPKYIQIYTTSIPYFYDLKGPICHFDTACGSSFAALNEAFLAIKSGICDQALVAGYNICLVPSITLFFRDLQMVSRYGRSKCLDESADGYGRSEGVCCILLQRASNAKRIYSTVVNSRSNTDGYKPEGISFPSVNLQRQLMYETYAELGLDPSQVNYVEAHTTGTQAGDPVEMKAIHDIFCVNRDKSKPLKVGCLKSNMGHSEAASGICATIKANIIFQGGLIPGNLHFEKPNPKIEGLMNKTIVPVTSTTKFEGDIISLNCFGFGGANVHVILRGHNVRSSAEDYVLTLKKLPRLVNISGRSSPGVEHVQNYLETFKDRLTRQFLDLLNQQSKSKRMTHRGYTLIEGDVGNYTFRHFIGNEAVDCSKSKRIYLKTSNNQVNIDPVLKQLPIFSLTIDRLVTHSKDFKLNLRSLVYDELKPSNLIESNLKSIAIQLAIVNIFKSIQLPINGVLTHSFGSLINLYANDTLTEQQVISIAYWFAHFLQESDQSIVHPKAEVKSSWDKIKSKCSPMVKLIDETSDSCVISGPYSDLFDSIIDLMMANISLKFVDIDYQEPNELPTNILLTPDNDGNLITSKNYILKYIFSLDNLVTMLKDIKEKEKDSLVVINMDNQHFNSSHLPINMSQYNICDISSGSITGQSLLNCLGQLYAQEGVNYNLKNLYPSVSYPVPVDTLSLHSLIKFDHSADWKVFKYPEYFNVFRPQLFIICKVNLSGAEDWYLSDHKIDGRILFPATGILMLAWFAVSKFKGIPVTRLPVEFKDVKLIRATVLPEKEVKFIVQYLPYNGTFAIVESGTLVATGKVFFDPDLGTTTSTFSEISSEYCEVDEFSVEGQDIYKEFRVRGYDYGPNFQCLKSASSSGLQGKVKWCEPDNSQLRAASILERTQDSFFRFLKTWITFTDSMMQLCIFSNLKNRDLYIPTGFESLICDPISILNTVNSLNRSLTAQESDSSLEKNSSIETSTSKEIVCPEFDVIQDPITKTIFTNGIWIKGLRVADTNRRNQSVVLETYDFTPFNETIAADEITLQSIEIYSSLVFKLIDIMKKKTDNTGQISEKEIESFQNIVDLEQEQHSFAHFLFCLIKGEAPSSDSTSKLSNDLLIGKNAILQTNQHFLKPFIQIAAAHESYGGEIYSKLDVVEINDSQGFLFDSVISFIDVQSLGSMKVNYTVVRSVNPNLETIEKLASVRTVVWNPNDSPAPSSLGQVDLVIYKLTEGSVDTIINSIDNIRSILKSNGHLLILSRENSTNMDNLKSNVILSSILKDHIPTTIDSSFLIDKMKANQWICMSKRTLDSNRLPLVGLMFKKLPQLINPDKYKIIHVDPFEFSWVNKLKQDLKADDDSIIWLVGSKESDTSVIGLTKCLGLELNGSRIRCLALRPGSKGLDLSTVDFTQKPFDTLAAMDCKFNVYDDELGWGNYCLFEIPSKPEMDKRCLTTLKDAHVKCLVPGDLSSLVWSQFNPIPDLNKGQNLITVNYSSLNFRDIMHATGRLPSNLSSDPQSTIEMHTPIGMEYSGFDAKGNRVMGIIGFRALATKVVVGPNDFIWHVPPNWTMEEAATIPVVYATVIYALIIRGSLRENETILIHAGTGGVGLAAINIALSMNCRVFTTVGTDEKKEFLRKQFPSLDETSFTHSRSTSFEEHIFRHTNGRGVDVVLNSLAEDKLLASLRCLAPGGRFLEIGKYDMMQNNEINLGLLDEGRSFHGILLDSFIDSNAWTASKRAKMEKAKQQIDSLMEQFILSGTIKPLPRKVFAMDQVEEAFRFMAAGKHIGKVLIKIRDEIDQQQMEIKPFKDTLTELSPLTLKSPIFYPNKVYIIVGGFGGFGLELANWLVVNGVRNLVLNSRNGPTTAYHKLCLKRFSAFGANSIISKHDLTNIEECQQLFNSLSPASIGGIFNCALVLNDALLSDQSPESFEKVCSSKVKVTHNLDQLTRSLTPNACDYFVVFSSVVCGRGNPGQSNYGLANSYMESVCQTRLKDGHHGLAIQWGYVGDVGYMIEKKGVKMDSARGTAAQRINSCLSVLDRALVYPVAVISSFVRAGDKTSTISGSGDLIKSISHILGIRDIHSLDPNITLGELGMDSLMALEVQQVLEKQFNISIAPREIRALNISKLKDLTEKAKGKSNSDKISLNLDEKADLIAPLATLFNLQIPTTLLSNLNDLKLSTSTSPVYYLPPIEGSYDLMKGLIDRIKRPALGLNWVYDLASHTSLESAALFFADYLSKCHRNGDKLHMIGYSFGGLLSHAIAVELESRFLSSRGEGPIIDKLVLIDSDPESLSAAIANIRQIKANENLVTQEIEYIKRSILRIFRNLDPNQFVDELQRCSNREERFNKLKEIIVNQGIEASKASDITKIAELTFQKGLMCIDYKPKMDLKLCKIIHFRAKDDLAFIKNISNENGTKLGKEIFLNGNHNTLIGVNLDEFDKTVNTFFSNNTE